MALRSHPAGRRAGLAPSSDGIAVRPHLSWFLERAIARPRSSAAGADCGHNCQWIPELRITGLEQGLEQFADPVDAMVQASGHLVRLLGEGWTDIE